ncbi:30S ribosomal protein S9 [Candidatus Woesebacteria bacterium RBG_13_34_9]|uniref:30S ribosomal protein S9 n=1 Tax=Candidatus Woesebacteria bacterium RBG_13_34_9 TaxID=1802477 RepID=A0A1F7X387_9BACT|nr:MAG: 30S ribosomal protein S9 [Candidatus Woesebacteria bacterium RBG_13_34_9]
MKKKKIDYVYAVGRRKCSSARVRVFKGKGESTVNGKLIDKYFPGLIMKELWSKPFSVLDVSDKYYVMVKVNGGGINGQLDAVINGISKAFAKINKENFRPLLKKAKLLTRDSRIRERRKVGTGGKARRKKQSPKR